MRKCCGNCQFWTDGVPTAHGKLPYYGRCLKGRPKHQQQTFKKKDGIRYHYCTFMVRSTRACADYKEVG